MSSRHPGRPEFRLTLGFPDISFETPEGVVRREHMDAPELAVRLTAFSEQVSRTGGRLTLALPEGEIWTGRGSVPGLPQAARSRWVRQVLARRAAARAQSARDLRVETGPASAEGGYAAAAVSRATITEACAFLARFGLRPERIRSRPGYPDFVLSGPQTIGGGFRPAGARLPLAAAATAVAGLVVVGLWSLTSAPEPVEVAAAPEPAEVVRPAPVEVRADAPEAVALASEPPRVADAPLAIPAPGAASAVPRVTRAARNMPGSIFEAPAARALKLAELQPDGPSLSDAVLAPPARAPLPVDAAADPWIEAEGIAAEGGVAGPMRRPVAAEAAQPAQASVARGGPRPRPGAPAADRLATAISDAVAQAEQAPEEVLASLSGGGLVTSPPLPRQLAALTAPQAVQTAPAPVAARAVPERAARPGVLAALLGNRAAAIGNVGLIGIFGSAEQRHALLLLPDGSIERVTRGDRVQGGQVAAIGASSVLLRASGQDVTLTLPD